MAPWYSGRVSDSCVQFPAAALSGNDLGQVVHTNVPLFTKQYKLVPCEGFHVNVPVCGSHGMKSNEQGEYCRSGSAVIVIALGRFAKNRYINYLLYYFTFRSKRDIA